MPKKKANS